LSVDDPIGNWNPNLGRIDKNIPIRLLLNHTSRLYRYQQKPEFLTVVSVLLATSAYCPSLYLSRYSRQYTLNFHRMDVFPSFFKYSIAFLPKINP
jgi:CubicO group peptidase (beta-lactamase class C family)